MRRIETEVEARQEWRIDTTASLGARKRRVSVTQLIYVLLVAIALADVVSIVVILAA